MMLDIKYPEITKNISTPINPPIINYGHVWNITTIPTAIVLRPSMSGR
jgi:hypothetical protein